MNQINPQATIAFRSTMTSSNPAYIEGTDLHFELSSRIGFGGQGEVYRVVDHPNYAIKLLKKSDDLKRIEFVSRLDLQDLAVVPPIATVRCGDRFGYLMELAEDMSTLAPALFRHWKFIDTSIDLTNEDSDFYLQSGGLKRRLKIAATVASTLASLHSQSLIYADLNPNNVMISRDPRETVTLLIDTDNLTFASRADRAFHFDGYAAPEVDSTLATSLTDAYSLAVITFQLLVLSHPFSGMASADFSAEEVIEAILEFRFPYVLNPKDKSNWLPPQRQRLADLVLSKGIQNIALQTFSEGLNNPAARPGVKRWRDTLFGALDNVLSCPGGCGWTFYRKLTVPFTCPSCKHEVSDATVLLIAPAAVRVQDAYRSLVLNRDTTNEILPRHLWAEYSNTTPVLNITFESGVFHIEDHGDVTITDKKTGKRVTQAKSHKGGEGRELLVQVANQPDRVIKFMDLTKT